MPRPTSSRAEPQVPFERRFGYRFSRIADALAQQTLLYGRREFGLNLAEHRIVAVLSQSDALSIREIARHTQLDKAHATRALTDLIDRGLATRVVDAEDRRLRVVRLTPAGRSIANATRPFVRERQERLEGSVSAAEFRVFDKVLAVMTAEAERMLAEEMQVEKTQRSAEPRRARG
ncbi:MarR family winged helix-turn-helix transcriptional regulator [Rhodoplanes sp. Z2-YC6860]|uniref:MarR family winged helix-turn-helix transcriptional regulator n=1 Tax=Rhodoplanes sp. Z2-YC6860 TaxID=674703 RepID=UPI0008358AD5|nr:MarR family transcriptional regulator [Rhodoplanes sp. Z2-YC6860]